MNNHLTIERTDAQTRYTVTTDVKTYALAVEPDTHDDHGKPISWFVNWQGRPYLGATPHPVEQRDHAEAHALATLRRWIDTDLFTLQDALQEVEREQARQPRCPECGGTPGDPDPFADDCNTCRHHILAQRPPCPPIRLDDPDANTLANRLAESMKDDRRA